MELCEQVWKFHFDPRSNVVQVFIMRLRKKLETAPGKPPAPPGVMITTFRGMGYMLDAQERA